MATKDFRHDSVGATDARRWPISLSALASCLLLAHGAFAQQSALNSQALVYSDYPQPAGKVMALQVNNFPKWATLDMQLRAREENQSSDTYTAGNDAVYVLTRIWGGLELRPTKSLTAYVQFVDAHALGLPLFYVAANQRDVFDGRQAFLEFHTKDVKIFAGRQELRYGNERLVGISNWTNTSRTWDGFLGRIGDKNRLDLFSTSVVAIHASSLDKHGAGLTFHGAVGTITTWVPHTVLQPFMYFKAFPRVQNQQKTYGTETEVTSGAEVSGKYPGGFYFDTLGAIQRGTYASNSISSGAGVVKAGIFEQKVGWKPRLGGEYDYASGNPLTNPYRIGTFDQLYPSNHNVFGLTDLFGFQNIKQERINLDLAPAKHLALLIQQEWLRVATVKDSVYSGSGSAKVKPPTKGFLSDDIGREFDVSGQYAFLRNNMTLNVGIGHFSPGTLMQKASSPSVGKEYGSPLTLAYFGLTYRFKVNAKAAAGQ
ncbi:MAG: alginate export family protein [Terracidiphilus sp.]